MAQKINIIVDQGSDWQTVVNIKAANGSSFDFTGYTGRSQIRKHYESANSVSMNVSLNTGFVTLSLSANTTSHMDSGRYLYDVEIIHSASNNVSRIIEGTMTISGEISK